MPIGSAESNAWLILIAVISYIIGSFPTAYLATKRVTGKDIRFEGSRNVGAMNAYRVIKDAKSGKLAAAGLAAILATDMWKGILAISVARWLGFLGYNPTIALIIGSSFVVLGHIYPFYFKFKESGRGIAAFMGVLLALNEPSLPIWCVTVGASIFTAQYALLRKMDWSSPSAIFSVIGTQVVGRVVGMGIALVPLYFFDHRLLFPALAATSLILIRHIDRVRAYLKELAIRQNP